MTRYNRLRDRIEKVVYRLFYQGEKDHAMILLDKWCLWWKKEC